MIMSLIDIWSLFICSTTEFSLQKGTRAKISQSSDSTTKAVIGKSISPNCKVIFTSPDILIGALFTARADCLVGRGDIPALFRNAADMTDDVAPVSRTM